MTRLGEALERARTGGKDDRSVFAPETDQDRSTVADLLEWTSERPANEVSAGREAHQGGNGAQQTITRPQEFPRALTVSPSEGDQSFSVNPAMANKLVVGTAEPVIVEEFRRLAAALHHAQLQGGVHTVMVASAVEGEGKTLTAANLALTLSHSYQRRVLLMDADLRRPSVHELFRLENHAGLGGILKYGAADGALPIHQVMPRLWVMTAGAPNPDPTSGLVSDMMREVIGQAAEHFDWVVIDTPPVGTLTDANLMAEMIDTAILVVSANKTPYSMITRAIEAIGASRVLGVVLNRADPRDVKARLGYYGYYGHYGNAVGAPKKKRWGWFPFGSK